MKTVNSNIYSKSERSERLAGNTIPANNQYIKWFFTYNNYSKDSIKQLLSTFERLCTIFVFQEELGKNGTKHLQGCIHLKHRMRWTEFKLPKEIHWEKCIDWKAAMAYCQKIETRDGEVFTFGLPKPLKLITELKQWQKQLVEVIGEEPDDRTIHWIYDPMGMAGKTVFSKYLYSVHDAIIATGGGNKDIARLLALLKTNGRDLNDKTTFIFNFPRSTEGISYKAIESVKDGLITSVKYESTTLVFNCPHVICMSNEFPDTSKLTKDRWRIYQIVDSKLSLMDSKLY